MADLRREPVFTTAVAATRHAITDLAAHGVADALALVRRVRGVNHLQGHANSIVPLAVLMARVYPQVLQVVRARTDLRNGLDPQGPETRDQLVWRTVKTGVQLLVAVRAADIIAEEMRTGAPQTVENVAQTYLSQRFGGGQPRGGAGDTVVKRTLKLMAHIAIEL
ncbi:MAG: hypothetical protein IRZ00_01030 [Gemmatimonadetes bacterium]|nr:hypothetical protein [Gemmatimonadota bacterium]